jgi:REP element-mobilizing transposase RayT
MTYGDLTKGRYSTPGYTYLVTTVTAGRVAIFREFAIASVVARELHDLSGNGGCEILAWVVMPDHLHALVTIDTGTLENVVRLLKGRSARAINSIRGTTRALWQNGFHDHALRREEDLIAAARYVVANPLRAGITKRLADYPFWNARWL